MNPLPTNILRALHRPETLRHAKPVPDRPRPAAKLERAAVYEPLQTAQAQEANPGRVFVRVTSFRRRLLDEDNLCEKYHVDCCRYAGLLRADSPDLCHIEVAQEKVRTKAEECTVIQIIEKP